jgi:hypothetical protein
MGKRATKYRFLLNHARQKFFLLKGLSENNGYQESTDEGFLRNH